MKEYIDFYATLQGELFAKRKLAARLKKHWGTTKINGVEVYNSKFVIWPGTHTERVRKVLDIFNIPVSQINEQSKEGIENLYLKFDGNKMDSSSLSREALATMIEAEIPFDEWGEFTLSYSDQANPEKFNGFTKEQIFEYVDNNYKSAIYQSVGLSTTGKIEGIDDYIGAYVLLDNGVDFLVEMLDASVVAIPVKPAHDPEEPDFNKRWEKPTMFISGINVKIRYKRTGYLNDDSPVVKELANDVTYNSYNGRYNRGASVISFFKRRSSGKTNILWYNGHIRLSTAKELKKHDYGKLIYGSIALDFTKKKVSGWKKWLGPLIIVVAVVITVLTWGAASPLVTIATAATLTTVALTVAQMVLAKSGDFAGAEYMGRWIKITQIVSLVAGIAALVQNLVRAAATQAVSQGAGTAVTSGAASTLGTVTVEGTVVQLSEITFQNVVDGAISMVTDSVSSMSWLDKLSSAAKVAGKLMDMREKNKIKELTSMSEEVKAQQSEIMDLYDKNLHMGLEDIRMYTRPLTQDNAQFEIDYLYEGTGFHIQRPSFSRYGLNVISNDIKPITEKLRNR